MTFTLTPVNLFHAHDYNELQRQRQISGWHFSDPHLLSWGAKQAANLKSLFWIAIPNPNATNSPIRAGHISFDLYADPPDAGLTQTRPIHRDHPDVLHPLRIRSTTSGVGRQTIEQVKQLARSEPYGSAERK
ncbi:hypothetical protein BO70DRAFT_378638, partial [Aspergillus heteromorphus CBS 117.55]